MKSCFVLFLVMGTLAVTLTLETDSVTEGKRDKRSDHAKGEHHGKHHHHKRGKHHKRQTDLGIIPVDYCNLEEYDRYTQSCIATFTYPNTTISEREFMHWQNRWILDAYTKNSVRSAHRPYATPMAGLSFLNISTEIYKRLCDSYFVSDSFLENAEFIFSELHYVTTQRRPRKELIYPKDKERTEAILLKCLNETKGTAYKADDCGEQIYETAETEERVCPNLPTDFNGELYDPLLDTIWHVYETVHSYCFPFFQNDNRMFHIYGYGVLDLFHKDVLFRWPRLDETEEFWERLLGPTWRRTGRNMELCSNDVIRASEEFPYRMGRDMAPALVRLYGFHGI